MQKSMQESVIVNLFPVGAAPKRRSFPGSPFVIKACKSLDKPQILVVGQQLEKYREMMDRPAERLWPSDQVARDVVQEARGGLIGADEAAGAIPGMWVSPGAQFVTPENRKNLGAGAIVASEFLLNGVMVAGEWHIPQDEIDHYTATQTNVLNNVVALARRLANSQNPEDYKVLGSMRPVLDKAAEWMKITGERWQSEINPTKQISCPRCETACSATAAQCNKCEYILNAAKWQAQEDEQRRIRNPQGDAIPQERPIAPPTQNQGNRQNQATR